MASALSRLGASAYKHRCKVIGGWAVALVALGLVAANQYKAPSSAISIPGTSAQKAIDEIGTTFPEAGKGSGRIVYHATSGTVADHQADITDSLDTIAKVDGVSSVVSPFVNPGAMSADKRTAYAQVQLAAGGGAVSKTSLEEISRLANTAKSGDLQVEQGGDLISKVPGEIIGPAEAVGLILALVVLLMTLGSLVSAGMPVITALVAVALSMAGLFGLSHVVSVNSTTPALSVMLGLAVGIDYSLFIISKYRSLLLDGYAYAAAAARAIGTAGNAVVFAAGTVVIALSALSVVQIPFMTIMGLSAAATVAVAAAVAITLIPAMLGLAGPRIFGRKVREQIAKAQASGAKVSHATTRNTIWHRWGAALNHHPVIAIVLAIVVVGVMAMPVRSLTLGLPTDQYAGPATTQHKAYALLADAFGVGFNAPLVVLAKNVPAVTDADKQAAAALITAKYKQAAAEAVAAQTAAFAKQQAAIRTPADALQLQKDVAAAQAAGAKQQQAAAAQMTAQIAQYAKLYELNKIAANLAKVADVKNTTPAEVTADGSRGIIQIIPDSAPASKATSDLISYVRTHQEAASGNSGVELGVTGSTALQDDINAKLGNALPVYLAVVVGLSLLLLMIAFRSILIPIKAAAGFLLSVLAMFGAIVAVFQWGWFGLADPAPIVSFVPILGIGVLFGLAMDYEFFLVSSMHEAYTHTHNNNVSIINGFGMGAKVVTAAAAIMVAVFAGFVGNNDITIRAMGFGLATGIFVDALIIRMTFVPAVMTLLGARMWWLPRWLDKILPRVSIEGADED